MNAIALSCIAFVCISGGALLGMFLRNTLAALSRHRCFGKSPLCVGTRHPLPAATRTAHPDKTFARRANQLRFSLMWESSPFCKNIFVFA